MVLSEKTLIKRMSNKDLVRTVNKIKKEKQNPSVYGKHGTTRWVTSSEFWGGHHQDLKNELKQRQNLGKISKGAGKPKRKVQGFNYFKF
jgi:hypothetical protein